MAEKRRLLIVDDSRVIVEGLSAFFAPVFKVLAAHSGPEALALIEQSSEPIDLVITDLFLPGQSGLALAGIIKARCPQLPVIVMTGWKEQHDALAQDSRADAVLSKPFDLSELRAAVDRLLACGES